MPRPRHQYRILQAAFVFALIGVAFFGAYAGYRSSDYSTYAQAQQHTQREYHPGTIWHWIAGDAAGFFTAVLCVVTGILAWFTYALYRTTANLAVKTMEASDASIKVAVEAAALARAEFIASHRPRMTVREFSYTDSSREDSIRWTLANVGGSKAIIRDVRARILLAMDDVELPPVDYSRCEEVITMAAFEPGGLDSQVTLRFMPNFRHDGAKSLYVFGHILYADEMERGFQTAFIRRYERSRDRFVTVNDPDYDHED